MWLTNVVVRRVPEDRGRAVLLVVLRGPTPLADHLPNPTVCRVGLSEVLFVDRVRVVTVRRVVFVGRPHHPRVLLEYESASRGLSIGDMTNR